MNGPVDLLLINLDSTMEDALFTMVTENLCDKTSTGKAMPLVERCPLDHTGIRPVTQLPKKTKIQNLLRYLTLAPTLALGVCSNRNLKGLDEAECNVHPRNS